MNRVEAQKERFTQYIAGSGVLIGDVSPTAGNSLIRIFQSLGAKKEQIFWASSYDIAQREIDRRKPKVMICDFHLGSQSGLTLIQAQRKHYPESRDSLFLLLTDNSSQTAVARAAEEEVDSFMIKPLSPEIFRNSLIRMINDKIKPDPFLEKIESGKKLILEGKLNEAKKILELAKATTSTPALACYYLGQLEIRRQSYKKAEELFKEGLRASKIHFKCMTGLYEVLIRQNELLSAYQAVKRISYYYPSNPQRLTEVLKLALMTHSYEDIERYYQLFKRTGSKGKELLKYVSAALVVCGKVYLKDNIQTRAIHLFHQAVDADPESTKILREIILALLDAKMEDLAEEFLGNFSANAVGSLDYQVMKFLFDDKKSTRAEIIFQGKSLLSEGFHDPILYQILVRRLLERGENTEAQLLVMTASQKWPEMKETFKKLLPSRS